MKIYNGPDFVISYIEKGNKKNQAVLLFPTGPGNAKHFNDLIDWLSKKYYVLSLDFPGTGKTRFKSNDCSEIGRGISIFVENQNLDKPFLIGESVGGTVIVELNKYLKSKANIFLGSGEYFNIFQKVLFSVLFFPPRLFPSLQRSYAKVISSLIRLKTDQDVLQIYNRSDKQLQLLSDRWNKVVWYKLPNYSHNIKSLLIQGNNDKVLRPKSINKLKLIYKNIKIKYIESDHFSYKIILRKQNFAIIEKFLDGNE